MKRHAARIGRGVAHLRALDPVMGRLIETCPPLTSLKLETNRFASLANSIISQQISIQAARAIRGRLAELVGPGGLTAEGMARLRNRRLREVGLSRPKIAYLRELARRVRRGQLPLDRMARLPDDRIVEMLVAVPGVGEWTAQMFLIFSLGRMDVFPIGDFGVRSAIVRLYELDDPPGRGDIHEIRERWRPWATIASWYCWRSHERDGRRGGV